MSDSSLSHSKKAVTGIFWTSVQKIGSMVISFGSNIVLARLLTPTDFGSIGMIMVFINLSNVFIDGGFGAALIQKKETSETDYSTIFYWNIIFSIFIYFILFFCSPLIADFYRIEQLENILKVLGLVLFTNALAIIQNVKLRKAMEFKLPAIALIISSLIALALTIIMAFKGYGVWSLVAFQLCQSGTNSLILWIWAKWKPILEFSWESFKHLFKFGAYLLMSTLLGTLGVQLQSLFIGRICSTDTLGYFTQARNLEQAPTNAIYSIVGQVAFPLFSAHQSNPLRMADVCRRMVACVGFFIIPLMFLFIILAQPIFIFLLSAKWLPAVPYFQILCFAGIVTSLDNINYYAVAASGASKLIFKWSIIKNLIAIALISTGIIWDIYGILLAVVISCYINFFIDMFLIKYKLGMPVMKQLTFLLSPFFISLFLLILIMLAINFNLTNEFVGAITFLLIYSAISYLFKFKSLEMSKEALLQFIKKRNISASLSR